MNQKSQIKDLKDLRCPQCRSLLYKYKIYKERISIEVKCYSCNSFSTLNIELKPLFELWETQFKEKHVNNE